MSTLRISNEKQGPISTETASLINTTVAPNTIKTYRSAIKKLEAWLAGCSLNDSLLANYITELHQDGKSPATISLVVAAIKWTAKKQNIAVAFEIMDRTLSGIRREGRWYNVGRGGPGLCTCRSRKNHNGTEGFSTDSTDERLPIAD